MKPKILLSANRNMQYYSDAVNSCGGVADAQYCPDVSTAYDGLILCGGNDINPMYYNRENTGCNELDERRDTAEIALAKAFIEAKKPIMGICRGAQLLNILFGGQLCQDLINASEHVNGTEYYCAHKVKADKDSICGRVYGSEFFVNSSHHQAVSVIGENLRVTTYADGVVEGFEHTQLPIFGVQWHPECMCFSQKREDTVDGALLFKYFLELCKHNDYKQTASEVFVSL